MLRLTVLLLLLANGLYFAWAQGYLLAWGQGPVQQSEPQRLAQQLRPDAVRLLKPDEVRRIETTPARGPECLLAGPLDDAQVAAIRPLLETWPLSAWSLDAATEPARWIVYMGKYGGVEQVARKKAELRQLGVSFEPLANEALEPGLSLGGFSSQAAAEQQMAALAERGVRTARVVQERPEQRGQRLTLPAVDETLRPKADELRAVLGNGKPLRPCR